MSCECGKVGDGDECEYPCMAPSLGHQYPRRYDALKRGLELAGEGWALEMGVHWGRTLQMITDYRHDRVAGFDSFEGLPEDWIDVWTKGTFALDRPPEVMGAEIVVGWFHETLPQWLDAHPGRIAFVHIDSDLYTSAKTVLDALEDRLEPGCVIVFDEFHNFPGWEHHEAKAWNEFVVRTKITYDLYLEDDTHQAIVVVR